METYCERSKRYNDIINGAELQPEKLIDVGNTQNLEDIDSPADTSSINDTSDLENYYTLFPEIRGAARKAYVKQGEEACKKGEIKKGMEEYCRKSERYNKIINGAELQPEKLIDVGNTQNLEDIDSPADTSSNKCSFNI
ncbi:hypothetical protein PVT01_000081500 [Plasmodium vivax]|uniref:VIR protein n=1 Tax=Plasmodium vivax TaxID=5855 RepID=A0A1G4E4U1_PLAVI|nr:hypothetical protein PVT01_000081500 [Plasmodium vivax]